jgi:hypothetical protein
MTLVMSLKKVQNQEGDWLSIKIEGFVRGEEGIVG